MLEFIGIIPARSGSKRLPGKNLKTLDGKTLVQRAIEAALQSNRLNRIFLSSDAQEILNQSMPYGPRIVPLKRPEALAADTSPAIDYVRHVLQCMDQQSRTKVEGVVIIQPSSPFTTGQDIDATIVAMETVNSDCAASVMEVKHALHPSKFKRLENGFLMPCYGSEHNKMAQHELEKIYVRNGSVYVSKLHLIAQGLLLNDHCAGHVMPSERSVDINDEMDWNFARFLIQTSVSNA